MKFLELLAPARNKDIGIAAIDCGADAVYIAGPAFGARHAAGNSVEDIASLCGYAHKFGARVYVTVNTIIFEDELQKVKSLIREVAQCGADALIVQDLAIPVLAKEEGIDIPMHASTQCAIRTPQKAELLQGLGFSRLVLERQLSLQDIRKISKAVSCEIEFFVHGALCVCYSGQCYLSEYLGGRSANRGECMQACRSRYDLLDKDGRVISRGKAFLSLKDLNLEDRMESLADAGVCSFKIEGRLKNESYVRNVVREYSLKLDSIVSQWPEFYARSSFGTVRKGFTPDPSKTFNRGYTTLFIDGKRGQWDAMDTPKSVGEPVGTVSATRSARDWMELTLKPSNPDITLSNGDGFAFVSKDQIVGFRADQVNGLKIRCKNIPGIKIGTPLWRNLSVEFEKTLAKNPPERTLSVKVEVMFKGAYEMEASAESEDGRKVSLRQVFPKIGSRQPEKTMALLREQMGKKAEHYSFTLGKVAIATPDRTIPYLSPADVNSVRRTLAQKLSELPCNKIPILKEGKGEAPHTGGTSYKDNISNSISGEEYKKMGAPSIEKAFEITHGDGAELMRSKYCLRYALGKCPKEKKGEKADKMFLVNNGYRLEVSFDCGACEMVIRKG